MSIEEEILAELVKIRQELEDVKKTCARLENHITFIENTYDTLRNPIDYIKHYFNKPTIQ